MCCKSSDFISLRKEKNIVVKSLFLLVLAESILPSGKYQKSWAYDIFKIAILKLAMFQIKIAIYKRNNVACITS